MALTQERTRQIVTLGILSALGVILMIIEIPYPFVPFLKIDLSDVVVLVVFTMYGWKESLLVGILKATVHILIMGPVGPVAIGQITALIASMSYVLGLYVATNKLNLNRVVSVGITVLVVTLIMTVANYFFVTPIWFGATWYTEISGWVTPDAFGLSANGGYLMAIILAYVPFNLIKGIVITITFFIVYTLIKPYIEKEIY